MASASEDATVKASHHEWESLEIHLERVVKELMGRDMQQMPFSQGQLIPRDDYISLYEQLYYFLTHDTEAGGNVYGGKLYDKYKHLLQRNIQSIFYTQEKTNESKGSNVGLEGKNMLVGKGEEGLEIFLEKFKTFKQKMRVLSHVFAYMERYYIPKKDLPTLEVLLKSELSEQVLKKAIPHLKIELASLMDKRRDGKAVKEELFSEVVALFMEITPKPTSTARDKEKKDMEALDDLETFLLQRTRAYYTKTATQWSQKAKQGLIYEMDFASTFLPEKNVSKFAKRLKEMMEEIVKTAGFQNADKSDDNKQGNNLENGVKVPLTCSTHHILQDPSKGSIVDAFRTTNV